MACEIDVGVSLVGMGNVEGTYRVASYRNGTQLHVCIYRVFWMGHVVL